MKVTLFMAMSINGYIARKNGSEDFLSHENWKCFAEMANDAGCIVWGRKTYGAVKKWGKRYQKSIEKVQKIIISKDAGHMQLRHQLEKRCIFARSPDDAIKNAAALGYKQVLLAGGGKLNSAFLMSDLIDEIIINIEPILLGGGIPLFAGGKFEKRGKLIGIKRLQQGIIQLHYVMG